MDRDCDAPSQLSSPAKALLAADLGCADERPGSVVFSGCWHAVGRQPAPAGPGGTGCAFSDTRENRRPTARRAVVQFGDLSKLPGKARQGGLRPLARNFCNLYPVDAVRGTFDRWACDELQHYSTAAASTRET